jgi:butyrate kinase
MLMQELYILSINPGSTSTKVAIFRAEEKVFGESISHSAEDLAPFHSVMEQYDYREKLIITFLRDKQFDLKQLAAVVGRGGLLTPMKSGTYQVTPDMIAFLKQNTIEHASNLGALLAADIARAAGVGAFIVDPIVVDEMDAIAKVTGLPQINRQSIFHALNQKAAAREAAKKLGKNYTDVNLIVAHLGGGISVGAHRRGMVVDVNNALNGDGPFAPERAGQLPSWSMIELALSGRYDVAALKRMVTGKGGIVAHLNLNDMRKVEERIKSGDKHAEFICRAMVYNIGKAIGAMAATLHGQVDAVVITGGIAYDKFVMDLLTEMVAYVAPLIVIPGEDEMRSLTLGALRVLRGEEQAKIWTAKMEEPK